MGHKMRVIHRYLGFFLAGIMAVYAISGIVLIFRDSDTFTREIQHEIVIKANISPDKLGEALDIKRLKLIKNENGKLYFEEGVYDSKTGQAKYSTRELPFILDKMTHLHKAKSSQPLYVLNMIFGLSLLFFVISSFWMFLPGTKVFRRGMLFTIGGLVLALVLLFV